MDSKTIIPFLPLSPGNNLAGFSFDASTANHQLMLLPDEHEIIINVQTGHFMLVNWDGRYVTHDGVFRALEVQLVLTLFNAWPSYVPIKKLLHGIFDQSIQDIEALYALDPAEILRILDHLMTACNVQLDAAGLVIEKVADVGYKVSRRPPMTSEQLRDQQIRLEQADARRLADQALRAAGRVWGSGSSQEGTQR